MSEGEREGGSASSEWVSEGEREGGREIVM